MLKVVSFLVIFYGLIELHSAKFCRKTCIYNECFSADCDVYLSLCKDQGLITLEGIDLENHHNDSLCFCEVLSCNYISPTTIFPTNQTGESEELIVVENVHSHKKIIDGLDAFFQKTWLDFYHIIIKNGGVYSNSIATSLLHFLPSFYFSSLQTMDFSTNEINGTLEVQNNFPALIELNLANNKIETFSIKSELPSIQIVNIKVNQLNNVQGLSNLKSLNTLDLSHNSLSQITSAPLKSTGINDGNKYKYLYVDLSNNKIKDISQIQPLLLQFETISDLNLARNHIRKIYLDVFPQNIYKSVTTLSLHGNEITSIGPNSLEQFKALENLDLTNNLLQHLPVIEFPSHKDRIARSVDAFKLSNKSVTFTILPNVSLDHNPWSCDCYTVDYHAWLLSSKQNNTFKDIVCQNPKKVAGRRLSELQSNELICVNATAKASNISANEFEDVSLLCNVTGAPLPIPYWISPINETISAEDENFDTDIYSISPNGQILTVKYLKYYKTGFYRYVHILT